MTRDEFLAARAKADYLKTQQRSKNRSRSMKNHAIDGLRSGHPKKEDGTPRMRVHKMVIRELSMETKFVEIRDRGTFIPALAISIAGSDDPLAKRAGFGNRMIILCNLAGEKMTWDPYHWGSQTRTMHVAHDYLEHNWDNFRSGGVVRVEHLLGERPEPKTSEVHR